jgi:Fuc2NAc and GlcNAc transferase
MKIEILAVAIVATVIAAWLTGVMRRRALARGLLDVPNSRSSHTQPTPRGGGAAIVAVTLAGLGYLTLRGYVDAGLFFAASVGGAAIAIAGALDDRRGLPALVRMLVHIGAGLWALYWMGGLPPLRMGDHLIEFGWFGYLLGTVGVVWTVNLFNFMDGIDGIAAGEAVFVMLAGAAAAFVQNSMPVASAGVLVAAASLGFLRWNWAPAKIFMGDVGSGFLGFMVVVLALAAARDNPVAYLVWLTLGGVFFVDATITLFRRLARRESLQVAHRSHAYQHLARRWNSHRRVTLTVAVLNVVWLLPWAWFASQNPDRGSTAMLCALLPLAGLSWWAGSGRKPAD